MSKNKSITRKDLQAIRGALRTAFIRSDYKKEFLKSITIEKYKLKKDGTKYNKATKYFECCNCRQLHFLKDCRVDHIEPIGQYFDYDHTAAFIDRLWCGYDNLQGLCDSCHKEKTAFERGLIKGYALL